MEHLCLLDPVWVELVLNDLFLKDLVAELKLIDTVNKVFLWKEIYAGICAGAHHRHLSDFRVIDDFFKAKCFIASNEVKSYDLL